MRAGPSTVLVTAVSSASPSTGWHGVVDSVNTDSMTVKSVMALSALGHQCLVMDLFTPLDWEPHEDGVGLLGTLLCLQYSAKSWMQHTFELADENLKEGRWDWGVWLQIPAAKMCPRASDCQPEALERS